ncbi:MAG: ATP-binding cassette domain-containing protein [Chloroflexota bacterium]
MAPIIQVEHLVKRYKGAEANAVDDVSFTVQPGELFALLGPNGAGKTTTISVLTTTLVATSGRVVIAGHDLQKDASGVRRNVGIIFQQPSLDLNLTAEENVRLHAILYGRYPFRPSYSTMPRAYRDEVRTLAEVVGIQDELFKPLRTFSGGMKRKLEIVRSLIHQPAVLFLDEPTTGLDPASRRSLWEYLSQVRSESGTTIFLTTHYLEEAEAADHICIINRGRVVAEGTPTQVKSQLLERYLLLDSEDRGALRHELVRRGIKHVETPVFKISLNGTVAQELVRSIATPLSLIQTHEPSLEDAYLEIVAPRNPTGTEPSGITGGGITQ